jgi:hypothetical protein
MAFDIFNYGNNLARRLTTATVHQAVPLSVLFQASGVLSVSE